MKAHLARVSPIIGRIRDMVKREEEVIVVPVLNDDLTGLSRIELEQEIKVIERRKELAETDPRLLQPEGLDGLNYRLGRLQAQLEVVKKKERKM